jgi:hypothetical protein
LLEIAVVVQKRIRRMIRNLTTTAKRSIVARLLRKTGW